MARQTRTLEHKLQNALRDCQKRDGNKRCADCTERLPQWVITNFNTFVCTACSGIHREFTHRVKSISLATFTEEEVEGVKKGGNIANNKLYMAKYRPGQDLPEPEGGRPEKHRAFIRAKYIDKLWYATPEDLKFEADREAEREAARAKREAARSTRKDSTKRERAGAVAGGALSGTIGENARVPKPKIKLGSFRRVSSPPGSAAPEARTPPAPSVAVAPKPTADLLDLLSDASAPNPPAAAPAVAQQPAQMNASQPWDAFESASSGDDGFATAIATNSATAPPTQQPQTTAHVQSWASFGDTNSANPVAAPVAEIVGMQPQQAPASFSTDASNGPMGGPSAATFSTWFSQAPFPAPQPTGVGGAGQEAVPFADPQMSQNMGWPQPQPTGASGTGAGMGSVPGIQGSSSGFPQISPRTRQPQQQVQHPPPSPAFHERGSSTGGEPLQNQQTFGQNLVGFASFASPASTQVHHRQQTQPVPQQHPQMVAMGTQQPVQGESAPGGQAAYANGSLASTGAAGTFSAFEASSISEQPQQQQQQQQAMAYRPRVHQRTMSGNTFSQPRPMVHGGQGVGQMPPQQQQQQQQQQQHAQVVAPGGMFGPGAPQQHPPSQHQGFVPFQQVPSQQPQQQAPQQQYYGGAAGFGGPGSFPPMPQQPQPQPQPLFHPSQGQHPQQQYPRQQPPISANADPFAELVEAGGAAKNTREAGSDEGQSWTNGQASHASQSQPGTDAFASLGATSWMSTSRAPLQASGFAQQDQPQTTPEVPSLPPSNPPPVLQQQQQQQQQQGLPLPPKPSPEETPGQGPVAAPAAPPATGIATHEAPPLPPKPRSDIPASGIDLTSGASFGFGTAPGGSGNLPNPFGTGDWPAMPMASAQGTPVAGGNPFDMF